MPRPRTPIAVLKLQSHRSNTRKALKRLAGDPETTPETSREIERLTKLIDELLDQCEVGATITSGLAIKGNPAFEALSRVVAARETLLKRRPATPPKEKKPGSFADFMQPLLPESPDEVKQ